MSSIVREASLKRQSENAGPRGLSRLAASPRSLGRAIYARLCRAPFRLGLTSIWPGTYLAYPPDRYSENYSKYIARGGTLRQNELHGFLKGNKENNCGDLARYYFLNLVSDQILKEGLKGDVAELGVYKGNTAILLALV